VYKLVEEAKKELFKLIIVDDIDKLAINLKSIVDNLLRTGVSMHQWNAYYYADTLYSTRI